MCIIKLFKHNLDDEKESNKKRSEKLLKYKN